jgi:hypothetical protein
MKITVYKITLSLLLSFLVSSFSVYPKPASQKQSMLFWATELQKNISAKNTEYIHKNIEVSWGADGSKYQCFADCSKSPHGKSDSRYAADGSEYSGLGKGLFRLYTDKKGKIVAYSWSTGNPKPGFDPYENPVVVGRFFN